MNAKKPSPDRRGLFCATANRCSPEGRTAETPLFRRGGAEPFALATRLRFWLGFGRLLDFFLAFVFASHTCKCDTKEAQGEGKRIDLSGSFLLAVAIPRPFRYDPKMRPGKSLAVNSTTVSGAVRSACCGPRKSVGRAPSTGESATRIWQKRWETRKEWQKQARIL